MVSLMLTAMMDSLRDSRKLKTVRQPSIDWLSSSSSMSNRVACGEHSSDVVRPMAHKRNTPHTSVSTILENIKQIPDSHECWLFNASRTLQG
jgi:hypothetical protein